MEEGADDFRQLHERPFSSGCPGELYFESVFHDEGGALASVPGTHEAARAPKNGSHFHFLAKANFERVRALKDGLVRPPGYKYLLDRQ